MKKITLLFLTSFLLISCGTFKRLTPEEIKAMTTTHINENYDLVFSSTVSLVQSQGFLITDADKTTGFIIASRQEDDNLAIVSKILFWQCYGIFYCPSIVFHSKIAGWPDWSETDPLSRLCFIRPDRRIANRNQNRHQQHCNKAESLPKLVRRIRKRSGKPQSNDATIFRQLTGILVSFPHFKLFRPSFVANKGFLCIFAQLII